MPVTFRTSNSDEDAFLRECDRLVAEGLARRWRKYHRRAARLRLVSRRANLSLLRGDASLDERPAFCEYCGEATHDGVCEAA